MWKPKKIKQNVASLPRGSVGKGAFAEGSGQLRSATLGKICPARVFPALPSVVAWAPRQRFFLKNKKPSLPTAFARGSRHRFFSKKLEKQPLPTGLPGALGKKIKKNKNTPLCRRPGLEAVRKEGFKNRQLNPLVNGYFFGRWPTVGSQHRLC
jgi:hypothetical protein